LYTITVMTESETNPWKVAVIVGSVVLGIAALGRLGQWIRSGKRGVARGEQVGSCRAGDGVGLFAFGGSVTR
jgi:hypothetical protein